MRKAIARLSNADALNHPFSKRRNDEQYSFNPRPRAPSTVSLTANELEISQDVLFGIAQLALDEVEGLATVAPPARVGEILTGRRAKGIQVERDGERVRILLSVRVLYGLAIPEVARAAQRAVREAVSSMTGLDVDTVEVSVEAVDVPEGLARG